MKFLYPLILIGALSSCGVTDKYKNNPNLPYSATKYDVDRLKREGPVKPQAGAYNTVYNKMNKPLLSLDLPVSFVADTVTFPYDVYKLIKKSYANQDGGNIDDDSGFMEDPYDPANDPYLNDTETLGDN